MDTAAVSFTMWFAHHQAVSAKAQVAALVDLKERCANRPERLMVGGGDRRLKGEMEMKTLRVER